MDRLRKLRFSNEAGILRYNRKILFLPFIIALMLVNSGCGIPLFSIPVVRYAPLIETIPEKKEPPPVLKTIKDGKGEPSGQMLAVRSGRIRAVVRPKTDAELIASLPSAELKGELFTAYVPPYKFKPLPAGTKHYCFVRRYIFPSSIMKL